MKQYLTLAIIFSCCINTLLQAQANQSLSNLISPTAINQALTPNANNTLDFGTGPLNWRNLYLNGSIFRNTTRIFNAGGNNLAIGASALNTNAGISNVAIGNNTLFSATNSALNNIGVGYSALYTNSSGGSNVAIGSLALYSNTTGFGNIAMGHSALQQNTLGGRNVGIGFESLKNNTTASFNTALGYIALRDNTTGRGNTAVGYAAMLLNTTGRHNAALGDSALYQNNGFRNTASGAFSLWQNTSGNDNTAAGANSLAANTTGFSNVVVGSGAMITNTSGSFNTALGFESMKSNTSAFNNTAIGANSLKNNTTGYFNTAIGTNAAASNTTGYNNTALGSNSLLQNESGNGNIAIGRSALQENKSGSKLVAIGDSALLFCKPYIKENYEYGIENTAVGAKALYSLIDGSFNTAVGFRSLIKSVESRNTAIGAYSLKDLEKGEANTAVGFYALPYLENGVAITALGDFAGEYLKDGNTVTFLGAGSNIYLSLVQCENSTAVGGSASITASHQVRVGNEFTTSIGGEVDWTTLSDGRFKTKVKQNVPGLNFINKLRAVTYNLDVNGISNYLNRSKSETGDNIKHMDFERMERSSGQSNQVYSGFIAQEVEEAAKSLNYEFSGVDAPKNEFDYYGLRYGQFVVPLVKAVQELSAENEVLKERLDKIEALLLSTQQNTSSNNQTSSINNQNVNVSSSFTLEQNIPNPFRGITTIHCVLPVNNGNVYLSFFNQSGALLKSIKVKGEGKNTITLTANELAAGTYRYALVVDGKVMDSKLMVKQ